MRNNNSLIRLSPLMAGMSVADIRKAESGFNYYGSVREDGSWAIIQETVDETTYRYTIGNGTNTAQSNPGSYESNFAVRDTLTYHLPSAFKKK